MAQVLRYLPPQIDPRLLVGTETGDDAAVYKITDEIALVQTVDFFPPIVDDPYAYGAIAAANSLSDVYAMGGKPIIALNIVGFPMGMDLHVLGRILQGGAEKAREAGVVIVGGHTIDDQEPKYGLAVTGVIKPGAQITNARAKPGDKLILTKPLGTGIITTAHKNGVAPQDVLAKAVEVMSALNHGAAEAMKEVGVNACTDITGFGLLGHLHSMLHASGVGAKVSFGDVPLIQGVWELAQQGILPGGSKRNREFLEKFISWDKSLGEEVRMVLCDAQTSGGLLLSVPPEKAPVLVQALKAKRCHASSVIGEVMAGPAGHMEVVP